MQNLLERLKPEILDEIQKTADKYPFAVLELKNELQNLFYVSDIRYGIIVQLYSYYLNAFYRLPNNAWENFIN
jgi:hypothetical protein